MKLRFSAKALALGSLLFSAYIPAAVGDDLPDGPGKAVLESTCQACHELDVITAQRNDRKGWTETVDAMKTRGATASDQDFATIIDYLTKYLGREPAKVNVNTATAAELKSALGLTSDESDAVVQYRKDHGEFKDWDSLTKVTAVDAKKLEAKKEQIVFVSQASDTK